MKPIEQVEQAIQEANGVGLVGYKSMVKEKKDTLHLIAINGTVMVLHDYHDERGSYRLYTATEGNQVANDIILIKSLIEP